MLLLHRITLLLACLFFVKQATSATQDLQGTYTDWIKSQIQGHEALSNTLGQLTDKLSGHIETSRAQINEAIARLQKVVQSYEYTKCSKNILGWIKALDGHDFAPCYNRVVYNSTVNNLKDLQAIAQEIPDVCKSKNVMADQQVMNTCVNETGSIVMKHMQGFENSIKEFSDSLKVTSSECVKMAKKKFETFVEYVNAGCPDGDVSTKRK